MKTKKVDNELKDLIERLRNDAKKINLQTSGNIEAPRGGTGCQNHRTRTQCFCCND